MKDWIRSIEQMSSKDPNVKWENLNVWYGLQLPKYLWAEWKDNLKSEGFTWQKFLRLLKHRTDAVLLWYKGAYTWEQLVEKIVELIEGPMGQEIAGKK